MKEGYLIFDLGTGDVRTGVVDQSGRLCAVCVEPVTYSFG